MREITPESGIRFSIRQGWAILCAVGLLGVAAWRWTFADATWKDRTDRRLHELEEHKCVCPQFWQDHPPKSER